MTRRSPDSAPIDPTSDAIRDELPREVLSYAEGLRREMYVIARRYGVEKPADIGPKIESGEVSMADADRMVELKVLLEQTVKKRSIPRLDEQRRKRDFLGAVEDLAETYREIRLDHPLPDPKQNPDPATPFAWSQELADAVERMPLVPLEELLRNPNLMREVVDALRGNLSKEDGADAAGLIATMIMNRSIAGISEELRAGIRQTVDGMNMSGVGYQWRGGELTVVGNVGNDLGAEMRGGRIVADHANNFVGARMSGGEIHVRGAQNMLGWQMAGGVIDVAACLEAGIAMSGGLIRAGCAVMRAGQGMTGGEIDLGSAEGASILRNPNNTPVPNPDHPLCGGDVGNHLNGGLIRVNGHAFSVGEDMREGTIIVRGTVDTVARRWLWVLLDAAFRKGMNWAVLRTQLPRFGGTIRYEGKGSWWKNLSLFLTSGKTRD